MTENRNSEPRLTNDSQSKLPLREPPTVDIAEDALRDIITNINRALDFSDSDSQSTPTNVTTRNFTLDINDYSLLERNMENSRINATLGATAEEIDTGIRRSRDNREIGFTRSETVGPLNGEATALQELLREIRELRMQFAQQNRNRQSLHIGPTRDTFFSHNPALDLTYGRTTRDVRQQPGTSYSFLTLKEARNMIPEIDGSSRNRVREFLNASTYAMKNIHPADETTLLEAMLCTKFRGKAMMDFHTREIVN
ncbi:hypothetical protein ALC57_15765 [Trachymyrmex cornetzi]|uniref:Uncharacterized protein n=1 Tax=Trachymyrmex cornetzi TaxID=471704 RepID=A0A151IW83_9HYME|nr:hypothetical protein ALC57_15765 [Trachymyrmex cornetzi]